MSDSDWLAGLKPGDEVALSGVAIYEVVAVDDEYIYLIAPIKGADAGWYFSRETGDDATPNDRPYPTTQFSLSPVTDELREAERVRKLRGRCITAQWHDLPVATLERVVAALEANDER